MRGRYLGFANNFVQGPSATSSTGEVYGHLLRALFDFDDDELRAGISQRALAQRVEMNAPGMVRPSVLSQALLRMDRVQDRVRVRPVVFIYDNDARRVELADKALLFYRRYGDPLWPWDQPDPEALFPAGTDGEEES
jgi:hypothetical protein